MEEFWNNIKTAVMDNAVSFCLRIICGVILLLLGFRLIHWITKMLRGSKLTQKLEPTSRSFVEGLTSTVLKVLLIVIIAGIVGVPTASIIAVLGSAGVAIGLALQGSLSHLAGGVMLLFNKPFKRGDLIEISGQPMGFVTDISMFYTTLQTRDNRSVKIPNGTVAGGALTNYSAYPSRRVDVDFSVEYSADSEHVREVILRAASGCKKLLSDPAPAVYMLEMNDSSINMQFWGWVEWADAFYAGCEIRELVKSALDQEGICIPFPQVDVHMK